MKLQYLFIPGLVALLIFAGFVYSNKPVDSKAEINSITGNSITINSATFSVKLATTRADQARGLGGVTNLPDNEGMLFIFDEPMRNSFWMGGMKIPLDMIFILDDRVVAVYENLPPAADGDLRPPTWGGNVLSNYVLEINAGLAKKYTIKTGDPVHIVLQ